MSPVPTALSVPLSKSCPATKSSAAVKDGVGVTATRWSHDGLELLVFTKDQLRIWPASFASEKPKLVINFPDQGSYLTLRMTSKLRLACSRFRFDAGGLTTAVALSCPLDGQPTTQLYLACTRKALFVFDPSRHVAQSSISTQRAVYTSPPDFVIPPAEIAALITVPDLPSLVFCLQLPIAQPHAACPILHLLRFSVQRTAAQPVNATFGASLSRTGSTPNMGVAPSAQLQVSLEVLMSLRFDPFRALFVPIAEFPDISHHVRSPPPSCLC
jgi:hypothetical protein